MIHNVKFNIYFRKQSLISEIKLAMTRQKQGTRLIETKTVRGTNDACTSGAKYIPGHISLLRSCLIQFVFSTDIAPRWG